MDELIFRPSDVGLGIEEGKKLSKTPVGVGERWGKKIKSF